MVKGKQLPFSLSALGYFLDPIAQIGTHLSLIETHGRTKIYAK